MTSPTPPVPRPADIATAALAGLWYGVGAERAALSRVTLLGDEPLLATEFRVGDAALAAIAASCLAATELWRLRTGQTQRVVCQRANAVALFRSERYLTLRGGAPASPWNELSGFYPTRDGGWIQLHTNFPHHRDGVLAHLGCADDRTAVGAAILERDGLDLEADLATAGLCAAFVRTRAEWAAHPQGRAVAALPVLEVMKLDGAPPRPLPGEPLRPLAGIRVLDLTRVIAGPVATRELAAHGADVLAVAGPDLASLPGLVMDVNRAKRSTFLDLREPSGRATLHNLAREADVFVQGYRPGTLASRGFAANDLASQRPGIVCVDLCAYSHAGPWSQRRGYDTLVQSATGIAEEQGRAVASGKPQHLGVSAIDHATGYLAAFGTQIALLKRVTEGGSWLVRVSLAQTGLWLDDLGRSTGAATTVDQTRDDVRHQLRLESSAWGELSYVGHAAELSDTPPHWGFPAVPLGTDKPTWR